MQIWDALSYILLMITVTTYAQTEHHTQELSDKQERHLTKRDASIFLDNFAMEPIYKHNPRVIYRRISRQKYNPKSKYGPPRTKYRSIKPIRKPVKKYRKPVGPKYGPPTHKSRPPKPRYGPPKTHSYKPIHSPPKKTSYPQMPTPHTQMHYSPEPVGFGEPPADFMSEYHAPRPSYGEPPVNSYGSPLKPIDESYPTVQTFQDTSGFDNHEYNNFGQDFKSWQSFQSDNVDNNYAYSKKRPLFVTPEPEVFENPTSPDEDYSLNSYSDIYNKYRENKEPERQERRKKPSKYVETKTVKPWKTRTTPEPDDHVFVGGQYAEPPGRYVPKFQPSAPMYEGEEEFSPPKVFSDTDVSSATISPYVNYKNSNMAFSPQNLNDAFSIVDK